MTSSYDIVMIFLFQILDIVNKHLVTLFEPTYWKC